MFILTRIGVHINQNAQDLANSKIVLWLRRRYNITEHLEGEKFFVKRLVNGRWVRYATPLFLVLVLVEFSDLIFAVDSIPAIFAITTDPFIVLTSNIFAILGLRSMFFLLADMADRFSLLKYGLALVLVFIGIKMMLIDLMKIPTALSLCVVATIIATSVILSLRKNPKEAEGSAVYIRRLTPTALYLSHGRQSLRIGPNPRR